MKRSTIQLLLQIDPKQRRSVENVRSVAANRVDVTKAARIMRTYVEHRKTIPF